MNVTLSVEEDIWKKYLKHCENNGYGISKRIMVLIKEDLTKNAK